MAPIAFALLVSLLLVPASMAGPILPRIASATVDSVSSSVATSTGPNDVPPPPVFTFGPSGLPHVSPPTTDAAQGTAPTTTLVLEMDWLS
ncbi:hypothetical protein V8D89_006307 [Ganoderma adspersum]